MFFALFCALTTSATEIYSGMQDGVKHFYKIDKSTNEVTDLGAFTAFKRTPGIIGGSNTWTNEDHTVCIQTCVGCRSEFPKEVSNDICLSKLQSETTNHKKFSGLPRRERRRRL